MQSVCPQGDAFSWLQLSVFPFLQASWRSKTAPWSCSACSTPWGSNPGSSASPGRCATATRLAAASAGLRGTSCTSCGPCTPRLASPPSSTTLTSWAAGMGGWTDTDRSQRQCKRTVEFLVRWIEGALFTEKLIIIKIAPCFVRS